jgi:hypothetical protein
MLKNLFVISLFLVLISCASTKYYFDLKEQGLNNLLSYKGKEFIYLDNDTRINQLDINNLGEIHILLDIIVNRKNPTSCRFDLSDSAGNIISIDVPINEYTNAGDNKLAGEYVVCLYDRGHRWYNYHAMDIDGIINISSSDAIYIGRSGYASPSFRKDNVSFQNMVFRSTSIIARGYHSLDILKRTIESYQRNQESQNRTQKQQGNVNKLVALLLNPMAAGQLGQFTKGETVNIPRAFLRIIDFEQSGNNYSYLVMINDNNINKPFYITANRMLNVIDLSGYRNSVFEDIVIQYVGTENYLYSGMPRETFVFQLFQ